uniref:Refilin B n=1 Tax=Bubo bubo TaxID=30461 RepID=A0A8C0IJG8_BUBBB
MLTAPLPLDSKAHVQRQLQKHKRVVSLRGHFLAVGRCQAGVGSRCYLTREEHRRARWERANPSQQVNSVFSPSPILSSCPPRLCPLSFGEGVEFDPLPPKEIRYTSSVKYDSEKHFIDDIYMPVGLSVSSCSQTVICVPDCTWRSYKSEVHFEPRNKPQRFTSTTIVYPKHAKTVYTTTLDYNCRKTTRRFLSSIELETSEYLGNDCVLDGC